MSVLIKGMEMQENCEECPLCNGERCILHDNGYSSWEAEYAHCPLRPAQERERWIPVAERLPIRGDRVICFGDNGINTVDFVCGDKWCALPWFYLDGEQETGVTHWMPLPEPPKEEET